MKFSSTISTASIILSIAISVLATKSGNSTLATGDKRGYGPRCDKNRGSFANLEDENSLHHCWHRLIDLGTTPCVVKHGEGAHFCSHGRVKVTGRAWWGDGPNLDRISLPCVLVGESMRSLLNYCEFRGGSIGVIYDRWDPYSTFDIILHYTDQWI